MEAKKRKELELNALSDNFKLWYQLMLVDILMIHI